jgi:acyl transferase domain-containing protein
MAAFEQVASEVAFFPPKIRLISNVTGQPVTPTEIMTPHYWCRHIREPVRFSAGMTSMRQLGVELFLEISSKPVLLDMGHECLPDGAEVWLPSLREGQTEWRQLLSSLAELYSRGVQGNWLSFDRDYSRRRLALPTYPWQRSYYWIETPKRQRQNINLSQEDRRSPIVDLLDQGEIKQLMQQLEKAKSFSEEQKQILPELLEVLIEQYQHQRTTDCTKDWFYQLDWQLKPRELEAREKIVFRQPGTWLIMADRTGVGQGLSRFLQEHDQRCILVYPGETYSQIEETPRTLCINPAIPTEFQTLLHSLVSDPTLPPLKGVVHLWSLESPSPIDLTISSLEQAQTWGCASVLHLVQTLVSHSVSPRLWLITKGAVAVPSRYSHLLAVAQTPLWGLGRVIGLEHPQFWGGMLDLDPDVAADEAATLLEELADSQGENQLAIRGGQRYVARLVRMNPPIFKEVHLRPNCTYLITGGLGRLGLRVAQWMVKQGAKHLVLVGRRAASKDARELLNGLEQVGARILVAQLDVANQNDMATLFDKINASCPPLRGVIHAAGVLDDGMLLQQSKERLARVMAPKVIGAWNLHVLTRDLSLDFMVLFSSAASLVGSSGQANYAAANIFLDALAHYRRSLGQPGLSLNWGPWAEVGMAADLNNRDRSRLAAQGLRFIAPEQGLQILGQVLSQVQGQIGVLPIDWAVFREQFPPEMPPRLFLEVVPKPKSPEGAKLCEQEHMFLQRLEKATAGERKELLMAYVQERVARILGLDPSFRPTPERSLNELGFDSLMGTQLKNRFMNELRVDVSIKEFIGKGTIAQLAGILIDHFALSSLALSEAHSADGSENMEEVTL